MKNVILFHILCLFIPFVYAQTGPGGVGKSDGTSNLALWLDASKAIGTSGSLVTNWPDASGKGFSMNGGTGAILNTNVVNGYPAFNFNGTSHYFQRAYTPELSSSSLTFFSATKVISSETYKCVFSNRDDPAGTPTLGYILYSFPTNNIWYFWNGNAGSAWQETSSGISTAGTWACQSGDYQNSGSVKNIYINGALTGTSSGHFVDPNTTQPLRVGAGRNENPVPDYYFKGDISEIIIFKSVLGLSEKILVSNYLSAKYGFALADNDLYTQDNPANGNYDHDVAGIGRTSSTDIHNDSRGTGILEIKNPSNLDDNEFYIWGHNNLLAQATNLIDIPLGVEARFQRVWRGSEVNLSNVAVDVGAVDIDFDLTGLGTVVTSDLRLLIDANSNGIFSDDLPLSGAVNVGGNHYQFQGITALENGSRFTIGTINSGTTPLPVELIAFDVEKTVNREVKSVWDVDSEINLDHYQVERTADFKNWEFVGNVFAQGLSHYELIDPQPLNGLSYYRLTSFDQDYSSKELGIRSIDLELDSHELTIFPNPADEVVSIIMDKSNSDHFYIINHLGQNVSDLVEMQWVSDNQLLLKIEHLAPGIFHLGNGSASARLIVN